MKMSAPLDGKLSLHLNYRNPKRRVAPNWYQIVIGYKADDRDIVRERISSHESMDVLKIAMDHFDEEDDDDDRTTFIELYESVDGVAYDLHLRILKVIDLDQVIPLVTFDNGSGWSDSFLVGIELDA